MQKCKEVKCQQQQQQHLQYNVQVEGGERGGIRRVQMLRNRSVRSRGTHHQQAGRGGKHAGHLAHKLLLSIACRRQGGAQEEIMGGGVWK